MMHSIDARAVWMDDTQECRRLYRQFATTFRGNFAAIRSYYGWKRAPMLRSLRQGQPTNMMKGIRHEA
jgi:hypothetical protein